MYIKLSGEDKKERKKQVPDCPLSRLSSQNRREKRTDRWQVQE